MQLVIKKEIEETIEVGLPCYVEYHNSFNKIVSPSIYIQVVIDGELTEVKVTPWGSSTIPGIVTNGKPIPASVFDNALQTALGKLFLLIGNEDNSSVDVTPLMNALSDTPNDADDLKDVNI